MEKEKFFFIHSYYSVYRNSLYPIDFSGNQDNHQNFVLSLVANKLFLIFIGMKQKSIVFWKNWKKIKIADSTKLRFSTLPILNIFSWKFHGLPWLPEKIWGLYGIMRKTVLDIYLEMNSSDSFTNLEFRICNSFKECLLWFLF